MPPRERVDFTHRELEALLPILANSRDDLSELYGGDRVMTAAGGRAIEKIERAYRKATTGQAADPDVLCNRCNNKGAHTPGPGGQDFGCPGCGHLLGQHPNGLEARQRERDDKLLDGYGAMLARRERRGEP